MERGDEKNEKGHTRTPPCGPTLQLCRELDGGRPGGPESAAGGGAGPSISDKSWRRRGAGGTKQKKRRVCV